MKKGFSRRGETASLDNALGESGKEAPAVDFDAGVKLEFHGSSVTSDAGLVAVGADGWREPDSTLCGGNLRPPVLPNLSSQIPLPMMGVWKWKCAANWPLSLAQPYREPNGRNG